MANPNSNSEPVGIGRGVGEGPILRPDPAFPRRSFNQPQPPPPSSSDPRPGPSGLLPPPRVGEALNAFLTSSPGVPRRRQRLDDAASLYSGAGGADLARTNSFASAMEPSGRYYQNPFYELPTYALPFQDGSPLNRGVTGATRRGPSVARRNGPNPRGPKAYVAHNPFKANPGRARNQVPEDWTFDNIAAISGPSESVYPSGEPYLHPPPAPYAATSPVQRPYPQQAFPSQGYVQPGYQQPQSQQQQQSTPYGRYQQAQTPLSAHPSTQQEQVQTRPLSPPPLPQMANPFQGSHSDLPSSANQEYGSSTSQGMAHTGPLPTQSAPTYPPSRPQAQDSASSPPRPNRYTLTPNILSPSSPPAMATRPNRMSFGFSSFQPPANAPVVLLSSSPQPTTTAANNDGRTSAQATPQPLLTPIQEGTDNSQSQRPSRTSYIQDHRTSAYESFNPYDDTSPLVPPPPIPYLVNRPSTPILDGPLPNSHQTQPSMLYDTGSGFGSVPDLDDGYVDASIDSTQAKRSFGDTLLSFLAFMVIIVFLPIIIPYKLIRKCFGSRDAYQQIPSSSEPSKLDVALRYVGHVPKSLYQHFLLLRLPNLYFSRVARIFEEADLSLNDLKTMALESAEKNLSNKNGGMSTHVWQWEHGGARGCLPPAYDSLRATWDEFVGNLLREWKTFNLISVLLLSAILTILQIDAAAADPYTRYFALSSLICALVSLLYGCVYIIRFGTMRKPYKAAEWALEAKKSKVFYWNVWVLLAMPAVYLAWSLLLFICCIMAFVWRTGIEPPAPDLAAPTETSDPTRMHMILRTIVSFILALGCIYGALIGSTFQRYGTRMDKAWMKRIDGWVEEKRRVKQQIDLEIEREREMLEREADELEWNEDAYETTQRPPLGRQNTGATGTTSIPQPSQPPPFIPSERTEGGRQHEQRPRSRGQSTDSNAPVDSTQRRPAFLPVAVPVEKLPSYRESDEMVPREGYRGRNTPDSDAEEDEYGDGSGMLGVIAASGSSFGPIARMREGTQDSQRSRESTQTSEGRTTLRMTNPPVESSQSPTEMPAHARTSSVNESGLSSTPVILKASKQGAPRNTASHRMSNAEKGETLERSRETVTHSSYARPDLQDLKPSPSNPLRTVNQSREDSGHRKTLKPETKGNPLLPPPPPPPPPPPRISTIDSSFRRSPPPPPPPPAAFVRPPPPPPLPPRQLAIDIESPIPSSMTTGTILSMVNLVPPSPIRSASRLSEPLTDSPGPFNSDTPLLRSPASSSSNVNLLRNEGLRNVLGSNDPAIARQSPSPSSRSSKSPGSASWDGGYREGGGGLRSGGVLTPFESLSPSGSSFLLSPVPSPRPAHSKSMSTQEHMKRPAGPLEGGLNTRSMEPLDIQESASEAKLNRELDAILQRKKGGGSVRSGGA